MVSLAGPAGTGRSVRRGVLVHRLLRLGPRRYPFAAGLWRALAGAQVVHVHGVDGLADQLVSRPAHRRPPIGISTHGGYLHTPRQRSVKAVWLRTLTRRTFARADAVWFTSVADRRRLAPAGRDGPVLPNGVDVARFGSVPRAPEPGRWLVPGRIDVHKGLDDLMVVLGRLAEVDSRPFTVTLAGPESAPGLRRRLLRLAAAHDVAERVRFTGALSPQELAAAMARAELVLLPSRFEGFGIAAVEAMAAGAPVAVADIASLRAHVHEGVDGFVVPFREPEAAARRLLQLRGADLVAVGQRAAVAAGTHGFDRRAAAFEDAYRRLLP
ncbi:MAG: glycosyltransferase [Myxococcales bacterium]|nr:glycosyltransferase [Myxococcales bacterium]